ncbi:glycosyltransferase family 4 protein [Anaeromyxobacter paludicola]|uniref:glycosyltransferase family 4 protein n=1 Tax=Anaeromyxobacter paludicola TaxID=2918171 RepID=UPI0020C00443|nr:glycosyltransferase family 4 protein [Anaeromyxobacter paludicola]
MNDSARITVIFGRFGPYHAARLAALTQRCGEERVLGLEVASGTREYDWEPVVAAGFRRRTAIRGADYQDVSAIRRSVSVVRALEEESPDVVGIHGWAVAEALSALAWCKRRRRVAVLMSDSQEHDCARNIFKETGKAWIVRRFDAALVGGPTHADYLVRMGMDPGRIALGYDVVDNAYFAEGAARARAVATKLRRELALPERYFLCSARFIPKKNLSCLLEAYGIYRRGAGKSAWQLVLLGDGPLRSELEATRGRLGLKDTVLMPGFKQYAELPSYYGLASGFVLPSTTEQWGLVTNEAMAAGVPVLVSEAAGSAALVRPGVNGFTFPPTTPALAAAMSELARDAGRADAMGTQAAGDVERWGGDAFVKGFMTAMRAGDRRYRVFSFAGRDIAACRREGANSRHTVEALPRHSVRARAYRSGIALAVKCGGAPLVSRSAATPVAALNAGSAEALEKHLCDLLGDANLAAVFVHPRQLQRRRIYVHLFDKLGRRIAFAKASLDSLADQDLVREAAGINEIRRVCPERFTAPRVIGLDLFEDHRLLVLEGIPVEAKCVAPHWSDAVAGVQSELAGSEFRLARCEKASWWPLIGAEYKDLAARIGAGAEVRACRAHGDFVHWNLVRSRERLWLFDWESFAEDAPVLADPVRFWLGRMTRWAGQAPGQVAARLLADFDACGYRERDVMLSLLFLQARGVTAAGEIIQSWRGGGA